MILLLQMKKVAHHKSSTSHYVSRLHSHEILAYAHLALIVLNYRTYVFVIESGTKNSVTQMNVKLGLSCSRNNITHPYQEIHVNVCISGILTEQ